MTTITLIGEHISDPSDVVYDSGNALAKPPVPPHYERVSDGRWVVFCTPASPTGNDTQLGYFAVYEGDASQYVMSVVVKA